MKKISILLIALVASLASQAQQWVSTAPGKKKAVIEEYTGHQCQFCPDGHKIADQLTSGANTGNVFAVNIHAGGYAAVGGQYVNILNIPEGEALAASSGLGGYPAGTVNRDKTPWATNRGSWSGEVTAILAQNSPANVAVKSNYDRKTGILKTEVEVYYTANGTGTSNRLHLMLVQDSILGPQSGGTTWYPANFKNGQYIHNKVLRQVLTNINGDTFQTIKANSYRKFTYETAIPAVIGNVPVNLDHLSVVAFVSETLSKVITADKTKVAYDKTKVFTNVAFDHSDDGTSLDYCIDKINPRVKVTNNSTISVTKFDLHVVINGKLTVKQVVQPLAIGETKTFNLGDISFTPGAGYNTVKVNGLYNINDGDFIDNATFMDDFNKGFYTLKANDVTGDKNYDLETTTNVPLVDQTNSPRIQILNRTALGATATWDVGAETSKNAYLVDLRASVSNNKDNSLLIGRANIPNNPNLKFSYYYAYSDGDAGGTIPKITLSYSEDCGLTWKQLDQMDCTPTSTGLTSGFLVYLPKSSEYIKKEIDLTALKGKNNIVFKLTARPGTDGGGLWLDQINLKLGGATAAVKIMDDSTYKAIGNIASVTDSSVEIKAMFKNVVNNDEIFWRITDVKMATGWEFSQICDAECFEKKGTGFSSKFNFTSAQYNNLLPKFKHNKRAGYGFILVRAFKNSDSAGTVTNTKISLLTSTGAATGSVVLTTDASDKLLHYFDNKIFVDREFNGAQLEVYDIKGQLVLDTKVASDNIDFSPISNGIYIARISKDGQVMKSHKFSTSK